MSWMRCGWMIGLLGAIACATAAPELQIEPKVLDLGRIADRSKTVPLEFKLKNVGDGVLVIESVKPGCGCTEAKLDKKSLNKGEFATVTASFKPGSFEGVVQKSITVKSNDPKRPTNFMSFKAKLPFTDTGLRLAPKFKEFRSYPWKTGLRVQIGIENCDEIGNATILKIDLPDGWQIDKNTSLPKVVTPESKQFFYLVNPTADLSVEFHDVPVKFYTDHPKHTVIEAKLGFRPRVQK